MKKLIISFFLLIIVSSCQHNIRDYGVVVGVKRSFNPNYKYSIEVEIDVGRSIKVWTDTLYCVGDSVRIAKK